MTKYGVILADPPWGYSVDGLDGVAKNHYSTMTRSELRDFDVAALAATDSLLLMWTTWAFN